MLVIGIAAWALLIPAAFLVRRRRKRRWRRRGDRAGAPKPNGPRRRRSARRNSRRSRRPFRLLRGALGADLPHGDLRHGLRHRAARRGHRLQPAGFSGLGGRLLLGSLADRLGAKPVLVGGPVRAGVLRSRPISPWRSSASSMRSSVVFGLAYGGVMPLYAVLVRDFFGARIMGTVFGAVRPWREPRHGARAGRPAAGITTPSMTTLGCTPVPSPLVSPRS